MIKIAVLGLGSRGKNYGNLLNREADVQIVSVCDKVQAKIDKTAAKWKVPAAACFTNDSDFFKQGRIADALIIATQDRDHYAHAMTALKLGYDILMEKPVSPDIGECLEIEKYARENNRKVLVCHVLRYAPYYRRVKEIIDSGLIGDIREIRHSENISYWHFAHSYVRGNWRRESQTSPMLLAKCCHDMDLLYWYTDSKCRSLSSYGNLDYFKKENAPDGCAENCFDCKYQKTCIYDAEYYYAGRRRAVGRTGRKFPWGTYAICTSGRREDILNALKTDEKGKLWARCVFKCDNDVVDNQQVLMEMENGVKCVFTVNAFNEKNHRHMEIRGTKGELTMDDKGSVMRVRVFDRKVKKIRTNFISAIKGHAGGDQGIAKAVLAMLRNDADKNLRYTWIRDTIESHRIVGAAEISRREGGRKVDMTEIPDILLEK